MIIVHHLNASRSHRILWLLEELGAPYEIARHARDPATMLAPAELKRIHPLGKSPVIVDDGIVVAESGAIIEHLLERHGHGRLGPGDDPEARRAFRFWLHYAEGSAMPWLLLALVFAKLPERAPTLLRPLVRGIAETARAKLIGPQLATHLAFWQTSLAGRDFLLGSEFTAADIQMSFPVEAAAQRAGFGAYPAVAAYLARLRARPAHARALAASGETSVLP